VAVGLAVDGQPGLSVLDMAAAPGGKTLHLHDQLQGRGTLIAADRHQRRVLSARRRLRRLNVDLPWLVADGRRLPFAGPTFDRVLLDAPCTGLGTLRRRPEIRHRLQEDAPSRAGELQRELLEAALSVVKPEGFVAYAVCTVFPEETTEVVAGFSAQAPTGLPGRPLGKGWLLGPHLTGSDGMFISLVRP
jgi:16S rRNA (cytosine967-C5)-methyltransferase